MANLKKVLVKCANEVCQTSKLPPSCKLSVSGCCKQHCHVGIGHCRQRAKVTCLLPWGKQRQEEKAVWLKGWKIRVLCPLLRHHVLEVRGGLVNFLASLGLSSRRPLAGRPCTPRIGGRLGACYADRQNQRRVRALVLGWCGAHDWNE